MSTPFSVEHCASVQPYGVRPCNGGTRQPLVRKCLLQCKHMSRANKQNIMSLSVCTTDNGVNVYILCEFPTDSKRYLSTESVYNLKMYRTFNVYRFKVMVVEKPLKYNVGLLYYF